MGRKEERSEKIGKDEKTGEEETGEKEVSSGKAEVEEIAASLASAYGVSVWRQRMASAYCVRVRHQCMASVYGVSI